MIFSPRLTKLQEELKTGSLKVLHDFWIEIKEQRTPLYERNEQDEQLVTFIVQDIQENRYVVISSIANYDFTDGLLEHLTCTDIYYKIFLIPNKIRTTYYFGKNLPDTFDEYWEKRDEYSNNLFPDPYNFI